jgi:hypothetical protein
VLSKTVEPRIFSCFLGAPDAATNLLLSLFDEGVAILGVGLFGHRMLLIGAHGSAVLHLPVDVGRVSAGEAFAAERRGRGDTDAEHDLRDDPHVDGLTYRARWVGLPQVGCRLLNARVQAVPADGALRGQGRNLRPAVRRATDAGDLQHTWR